MFLKIDPQSGVPIYRQLVDQIRYSIATGNSRSGTQIPSVRNLASELGVNPMTVQKAYAELEREGLLQTLRGQGTFVAAGGAKPGKREQKAILQPPIERFLLGASQMGLQKEEIKTLFEEALAEFFRRRS